MKRSILRNLILLLCLLTSTAGTLAAIDGPLKVHPTNPRYLTDDSGEVVFLAGSHTWSVFQDYKGSGTCDVNPPAPFDRLAWLDTLEDRGHNFYRGWHWEDNYYAPRPYVSVDGKYHLDRINPLYLDRLYNRINSAQARGIYVSVMLFQGWSVTDKPREGRPPMRIPDPWFKHHPYDINKNHQGVDGDADSDGVRDGHGLESHEVGNPGWAYQKGYIEAVMDRLNCFDNLLWEVSNESHAGSKAWQYKIISHIKTYTQAAAACPGKKHPIWMSCPDGNAFLEPANKADVVSPCDRPGFPYLDNPPAADGAWVVIADSDHTHPCDVTDDWAWKSFTRGLQPAFMDRYEDLCWTDIDRENCRLNAGRADDINQSIGAMKVLADTKLDLASMAPQKQNTIQPSRSGYSLFTTINPVASNPVPDGETFLAWEPSSSAKLCQLIVNAGYVYEWIDPLTAEVQSSDIFTAVSGCKTLNNTSGDASLLYVTRTPVPASPNLTAPTNGAWVGLTPTLTWSAVTAVPAVDQYKVLVRRSSNNTTVHTKTVTATSYQVPSGVLADEVDYKWRVRAHNSAGWGAWSDFRNFLVRTYVKVDLGTNSDLEDGLSRPSPEPSDGRTVGQEIDNACNQAKVKLRKNKGEAVSPAARYLYFKVDDKFIKNGSHKKVDFFVQYWDHSPPVNGWASQLCLQYESTSGLKTAGCKTVTDTDCMTGVTFSVTNARFNNGLSSGSDFRIYAGSGDTRRFVNVVRVTKR